MVCPIDAAGKQAVERGWKEGSGVEISVEKRDIIGEMSHPGSYNFHPGPHFSV